jgi:hypothetical protein
MISRRFSGQLQQEPATEFNEIDAIAYLWFPLQLQKMLVTL